MKHGDVEGSLDPRFGAPTHPPDGDDAGLVLNIDEIVRIIRRQLWLIVACVLVVAAASGFAVSRITPTYNATAQLTLGQQNRALDTLGNLFEGINLSNQIIAGEIAAIQSGQMLARVSERLSLANRSEFNPALREEPPGMSLSPVAAAKGFLKATIDRLRGGDAAPEAKQGEAEEDAPPDPLIVAAEAEKTVQGAQARFVSALRRGLTVRQVGNSFLIDVTYTSTDPVIAAGVANTVVDVYIRSQLEGKLEASRRLAAGLDNRLGALKARLEASERAVLQFRAELIGSEVDSPERFEQQLSELTSRLSEVRGAYVEATAALAQVDLLEEREGVVAAVGVLDSQLIDGLRAELAKLRQDQERLTARFGADSARSESVAEQIALIESEMKRELQRLRDDLANQAAIAQTQMASLRDSLQLIERRSLDAASELVTLDQLEREVDANRIVYENFLRTYTQTTEIVGLQEADARVISYATPPSNPSAPRPVLSMALGVVAGGMIGLGLAFLRELVNTSISSAEQLRAKTGLPVLASMPEARRSILRRTGPLDEIVKRPGSQLAEEARRLRNLLTINAARSARTVAVVSCLPGEGRTTTAMLLAHAGARAGWSCLVVDTNLRRASPLGTTGGGEGPDLVSVLTEGAALDEALRLDPSLNVHVLAARRGAEDPSSLITSTAMKTVVADLRARFDLVVLDAPPVFLLSDGLAAAKLADTVLFVVRWRKVPLETIRRCLRSFADLGIPIAGAALTRVDPRKAAGYEFRGYHQSYRAASKDCSG